VVSGIIPPNFIKTFISLNKNYAKILSLYFFVDNRMFRINKFRIQYIYSSLA